MGLLEGKAAVVFDMDGVLFDSSPAHAEAFSQTFLDFKLPTLFDYEEISGMATENAMRLGLRKQQLDFDEELIAALSDRKRQHAFALLSEKPDVFPGCHETLQSLWRTHALALATSSTKRNIDLFLKASGTEAFFSYFVSSEDVTDAKPSPAIFLRALELLGTAPDKAVIIEDSANGVLAGCAAGAEVIGFVPDDLVGRAAKIKTLQGLGAQRTIGRLSELLK